MRKETIHREKTNLFSKQQIDLSYNQKAFSDFISAPFSIDSFPEIIATKKTQFSLKQRSVLCDSLEKQYNSVENRVKVNEQIELLRKENSFTITTGHQLSLLTGPLYFIYKILHVIKLSEELKKKYPENNFIPVYWMASEDHDFEEIQTVSVFNKSFTWQSDQEGPVGKFDMEGLENVKMGIGDLFSNHPNSEVKELLDQLEGPNYGIAFRKLIHWLFSDYGLVVIDGDDIDLKSTFLPIMEKELKESFSSVAVERTNKKLIENNLKTQVNAREVNLFYIEKGVRERIVWNDPHFSIKGKGIFNKDEILDLLQLKPSSFSPNVVLRPVYQESILPNLCYVGGTGELTYWLQLKGVFDAVNIPYPLIQVRNSLMWIDISTMDKMDKVNIKIADIFKDLHQLNRDFVNKNSNDSIDFSVLNEKFQKLEEEVLTTIVKVDSNLEKYGLSEIVRMQKQLQSIKDKLFKTEKQKHDNSLKSIEQIKDRLFPNNGLQERSVNFLQLANSGDVHFKLDVLKSAIDPFENDLIILVEE